MELELLMARKQEARKRARALLASMSIEDREKKSRYACARLGETEAFHDAQLILAYMPMKSECSPLSLVSYARKLGKRVAFPLCIEGNGLALYEAEGQECFAAGSYGILEPIPSMCKEVSPEEIDFAVVPGLAFDKECNRLGRGAGYYDRLLARLGGVKVGLCFDVQFFDEAPAGELDVPMDAVAQNNGLFVKNWL